MNPLQRSGMLEAVESRGRGRRDRLARMKVARSTYYYWKGRYKLGGTIAMKRQKPASRPVNRLPTSQVRAVLDRALKHTGLSPRLLAVKITDESGFFVSESTVFRILKRHGLVRPRPPEERPASDQWRHKTTATDQIWQCDATHFRIPGWGDYKAIPIMDDYSRKLLALPLKPNETSYSISDAVEEALEAAAGEGHALHKKPDLLSDNGSGFIGEVLAGYLEGRGMGHIFGAPYHPQTQGKVERLNRKMKEKVCLVVHCSPYELERALKAFMEQYNTTPHEALKNVSPNDVYAGRQEEILKRRENLKRITLQNRRKYNQARMA